MTTLTIVITERELRRILGETIGHASVCWNPKPTGEFDTKEAGVAIERAFTALVHPKSKLNVPYPEFCRHPDKCAGRGTCPRDPCCCD